MRLGRDGPAPSRPVARRRVPSADRRAPVVLLRESAEFCPCGLADAIALIRSGALRVTPFRRASGHKELRLSPGFTCVCGAIGGQWEPSGGSDATLDVRYPSCIGGVAPAGRISHARPRL